MVTAILKVFFGVLASYAIKLSICEKKGQINEYDATPHVITDQNLRAREFYLV
jgi:hypothetical protein